MADIHFRVLGYLITIILHVVNIAYMKSQIHKSNIDDENVRFFKKMELRFFTTWTVVLQIVYAFFGLTCDVLILKNSKNKKYRLANLTKQIREILFAGLVWPCTLVVFVVFWTVFNYDRSLIFPEFLDQLLPWYSNHIIHTAIIPIVLWEVMFRSRKRPTTHSRNIAQLAMHMVAYICVLFFTYAETGMWLYPLFGAVYGSIHFVLIFVYIGILCLFSYYMQWYINDLIHGNSQERDVKQKIR